MLPRRSRRHHLSTFRTLLPAGHVHRTADTEATNGTRNEHRDLEALGFRELVPVEAVVLAEGSDPFFAGHQ